eukprot:SAG31_NODE_2239_length_6115_cov_2.178191_9_plen_115_part_00
MKHLKSRKFAHDQLESPICAIAAKFAPMVSVVPVVAAPPPLAAHAPPCPRPPCARHAKCHDRFYHLMLQIANPTSLDFVGCSIRIMGRLLGMPIKKSSTVLWLSVVCNFRVKIG